MAYIAHSRCIYERVPSFLSPTIMVFVVSAIWHGFYPAYFHVSIYGGITTLAARKVHTSQMWLYHYNPALLGVYSVNYGLFSEQMRSHVRPLFQHSTATKTLYDLITILTTSVYRDYALVVFALLLTQESWKFAGLVQNLKQIFFSDAALMPTLFLLSRL